MKNFEEMNVAEMMETNGGLEWVIFSFMVFSAYEAYQSYKNNK